MSANERGGLKAAFTKFNRPQSEREAEMKLLGRPVEPASTSNSQNSGSYPAATLQPSHSGLTPRPLLQREAVRQLSFRCPVSLASDLRRKAAFNQLEQQQILVEGIKRVLAELPDPPEGWQD